MNVYLFQRVLGIAILGLQILSLLLIGYLIYKKITKREIAFLENIFSTNGMLLGSLSALLAIIGSLVFSDYYMVPPCKLCWIQRIFIYPQALILGIAAFKKDVLAWTYSLWLTILGGLVALYQVNEQFGISEIIPEADCATGPDAACSQIHMLEFGYISFPVVSLSLFAFLIILYIMRKK